MVGVMKVEVVVEKVINIIVNVTIHLATNRTIRIMTMTLAASIHHRDHQAEALVAVQNRKMATMVMIIHRVVELMINSTLRRRQHKASSLILPDCFALTKFWYWWVVNFVGLYRI